MTGLNSKQQQILNLCAAGYLYKEMTSEVGLTERQIRIQAEIIRAKFGVKHDWGMIVPGVRGPVGDKPRPKRKLTKAEIRILCWLASDRSTAEIATKTKLAETTIRQHISTILFVTGARTRNQAVHYFYRWKVR